MYIGETEGSVLDWFLSEPAEPRMGYWSPFSTLAWIIARSKQVVAAVQRYEDECHANVGGGHTSAAWMIISDTLEKRYGKAFPEAEAELRERAQQGQLPGTVALAELDGVHQPVARSDWLRWQRTFQHYGLELLPNRYAFGFAADEVVAAFTEDEVVRRAQAENQGDGARARRTKRKYNNRRPTARQREAFRFLDSAGHFLPGGKGVTDRTRLYRIYKAQFSDKATLKPRLAGSPFGLTQFKEQVRRYVDEHDRIVRGRWESKTSDSAPG